MTRTQEKERPPSLKAKNTRKKCIKAVNKKLHEEQKQDKRARSIKKMFDNEYIDKECSIKWLKDSLLKYDGGRIL